jgi:hypothetical protein
MTIVKAASTHTTTSFAYPLRAAHEQQMDSKIQNYFFTRLL